MHIARSAPWLILLCFLGVRPGMAVVIDSGDGSGNTSAPADDPGWSNVGLVGNYTGVYLKNHWVLTAGHVGPRDFRLGDRIFDAVQGKIRHRVSTKAGLEADLQLFQLREAPELPPVRLASSEPLAQTPVVMMGNGFDRSPSRTAWSLAWARVPLRDASFAGYQRGTERRLRWGTNRIADVALLARTGKRLSHAFSTRFDSGLPTPHESQASAGDSGGPVFAKNGAGEWELVGIMITVSQYRNQPGILTVYGNLTYAVDVHAYREQIEEIVASWPDRDRDGVLDVDDNCTRVANPDQADRDGDGTGDLCEEAEGAAGPAPTSPAGEEPTRQ